MVIGKRFVFIRNPKTASTAIATALQEANQTKVRSKHHICGAPDGLYRFVVVRNPWDRMVSAFLYWNRRRSGQDKDFKAWLLGKAEPCRGSPFDIKRTSQLVWAHRCDTVIRYERLDDELPAALEKLSIPIGKVKRKNVSSGRKDYRAYYNDETAEIVADRFRADIDKWRYRFDDIRL